MPTGRKGTLWEDRCREFVEGVFRQHREKFSNSRKDGARRMKGVESGELFTLRDLRKGLFG